MRVSINGQNDSHFGELSITDREFDDFLFLNHDITLVNERKRVFERSNDMIDSYFMLSPGGNVMSNRSREYSLLPLSNVNKQNIEQIINFGKYIERGGIYDY